MNEHLNPQQLRQYATDQIEALQKELQDVKVALSKAHQEETATQLRLEKVLGFRDEARRERDEARRERDEAFQERDEAFQERDEALRERNGALAELDNVAVAIPGMRRDIQELSSLTAILRKHLGVL